MFLSLDCLELCTSEASYRRGFGVMGSVFERLVLPSTFDRIVTVRYDAFTLLRGAFIRAGETAADTNLSLKLPVAFSDSEMVVVLNSSAL